MEQKSENTEGCIFYLDYSNYSLSLNKNTINKIKNGEEIKSTIYHDSHLFKTKEDIQERMKKELIIGLKNNDSTEKYNDIIIEPYGNKSEKVIIRISNNLLENLINSEGENYEYCLNSRGNKITFYINDNTERKELNNKLEELEKKYSKE